MRFQHSMRAMVVATGIACTTQALPVIRHHLAMAQQLDNAKKGTS
ncbi:hypothetical protein [Paraburkholderia sp.]|nr:hypothetical protein [Paraburkholderia sp.]